MEQFLQTGVLLLCFLWSVYANIVHLPPSSPDFLRIGCYSYIESDNSTGIFHPTSQQKTATNCLRACANRTLPLAFFNNSTCTCSKRDTLLLVNITTCQSLADNNAAAKFFLYQVYNTSVFFTFYGDAMENIHFHLPNATENLSYRVTFGDGAQSYSSERQRDTSHRYLKEGKFKVTTYLQSTNGSSSLVSYRDVIIQQSVSVLRMSCPLHTGTNKQFHCSATVLRGSGVTVELNVRKKGSINAKLNFILPDIKKVIIGKRLVLESSPVNASSSGKHGGTFLIPALQFSSTTVVNAWEVVATSTCSATLQIFRPTSRSTCIKPCSWTSSCKPWNYLSSDRSLCNTLACLITQTCHHNTSRVCRFENSSAFHSIFSLAVNLTAGYNFISVPKPMESIYLEYGDLIGWTSNDTKCVADTLNQSRNKTEALFSADQSSIADFLVNENTTRRDAAFSLRVHGMSPLNIDFKLCNSKPEHISVHAKFSNLLEPSEQSNSFNALMVIQAPVAGIYHKIDKFMVINKLYEFVIKSASGTNLSCILTVPGREFVYSPFEKSGETKGLTYREEIAFNKSETIIVSFKIFNLVSSQTILKSIAVLIEVKGLKASLRYAAFAYSGSDTNFNASVMQGNFVEYYWKFESNNTFHRTTSTIASYTFNAPNNYTVTLYATNNASYDGSSLAIRVIPSPLLLRIPAYIVADAPQAVGCGLDWAGGSPQSFYQKLNLLGQKGADLPEKTDTIIDFGDGKIVTKNSSVDFVYHSYTRNNMQSYHLLCTVDGHPELSTIATTMAIDTVKELHILTDCPANVSAGRTCNFEAKFAGDLAVCRWVVRDGSVSSSFAGCSLAHKFDTEKQPVIIVNVSNPISTMENTTTLFIVHPNVASNTPILPSTTLTISKVTLNTDTDINSKGISSSPTYTTKTVSSSTIPTTQPIHYATLVCPSIGFVGQLLLVKMFGIFDKHLSVVWKFGDKTYSTTDRSMRHAFQTPGIYFVSSNLTAGKENVFLNCQIRIQHLIAGFRIVKLELKKDMNVELNFEILQGTNVSYMVNFGAEDASILHGFPPSSPSHVTLSHQYKKAAEYNIDITVSSLVGPNSTLSKEIFVSESPCTIHSVTIQGASRDPASAPLLMPQYEYSVASWVNASCDAADNLLYNWQIFNLVDDSSIIEVTTSDVSFSDRELVLPAGTLSVGLYKFVLTVTAAPCGMSKSAAGFVRVRDARLVVRIECGQIRTVSRDSDVIVNASQSYDPGNPKAGSSLFKFHWLCEYNGNTSWLGEDVERNNSILRIPKGRLGTGEYNFAVEVKIGARKASTSQNINVTDVDVPDLCIRCIENCDPKALLVKPVILSATGCQDNENITCIWRMSQPQPRVHSVNKRSVPIYSKQFVIHRENLKANHTYTVSLETTFSGLLVEAKYLLHTDNPPTGGTCDVAPGNGKVIETPFQITCSGWDDEDSPLWYEYYYTDISAGSTLLSYGWMSQSPLLYLPTGNPRRNYVLDLHVDIIDVLGSWRRVPLQVTVVGFEADDGPVGVILNGYVQGPSSKLGVMLGHGEQQQAVQLMTTISTVLNEDSTSSPSAGHSKRQMVRATLTKEFSRGCCSSLPSLRQVLGGLRGATKISNEVTPDAQINGAKGYELMAGSLATKYTEKPIESEVKGIVTGLSDVLESSEMTSTSAKENKEKKLDWLDNSNSLKNKETLDKSQQAAKTCLNGADQTARALVRRKKPGDEPSLVRSPRLEISVHRRSTGDVSGMELDKTDSKFKLPEVGLENIISGFGFVDAKVLTVKMSPFYSEDKTPIASQVSSLELHDPNGTLIPVNNLSAPISIFLSTKSKDEEEQSISGVLDRTGCMNITVYKIRLTEQNSSIYLETNCTSIKGEAGNCFVMWRKDKHPEFNEYDFVWNISERNGTLRVLLEWGQLNGTGDYFLGISRGTTRNASCGEMQIEKTVYNVSVSVVSCLYWDEKLQRWNTNGCQVGPQTTRHRTHCLCDHLTWFGSKIFVPPNKLDLAKIAARISDPSYYLPVLAVLCTIWLVYAVTMIWARREDKKDALKVGMKISPSNRPGNSYIYEVTVATGIRRNAGTTANTAIKMYGEDHDSDPYLLTDTEHHRTLQRGLTCSFFLTTKESLGQLLHIRLWHDNKGKDPALFLKHVVVRDIQTKEVHYFLCNRWFAVDEGDGMIDRVIPVTSEKEMTQFTQMFLAKTQRDLTDTHLWFSVVWRPPHSCFTRVQRVSCCLSLLLCTMMANALWYEAGKGRYTAVDLGPVQFSWEQISIGIMSSLIVFPVNLILVQIFRHSRGRKQPDIPKGTSLVNKNKVSPLRPVKHGSTPNSTNYRRLEDATSSSIQMDLSTDDSCKDSKDVPIIVKSKSGMIALRAAKLDNTEKRKHTSLIKNNAANPEARKKSLQGLPHWCTYLGWVGVVITSLVSSTITLMYGIQFGKRTSEKWLLSMFISVTQDIFVSQPLKVIALAVFFAFIIKKPELTNLNKEDEPERKQVLSKCFVSSSDMGAPCPPISKPSEDTIQMARKRRQQEKQMTVIVSDILTYLFFLLILLLIAYGQRDKSSFLQKESVEGLLFRRNYSGRSKGFLPDQFEKAHKIADMWLWLENVLLPVLYNIEWFYYTGRPASYIQGGSGVTVGVARIRQLRASKDGCSMAADVQVLITQCTNPYSMGTEDQSSYEPGWLTTNKSATSFHNAPWHYNTATELNGFPIIGNIETYSGGGYVLPMSSIYYRAVQQIHKAKQEMWVDKYTKAIFFEFNVYNPSSNLFTACTVLLEVLPSGGFSLKHQLLIYRLYRYVGDFQLFVLAMEVVFFLFVTYFTYREGKSLYKKRWKYFKGSSWVWLEVIVIILAWTSIAHYFICFGIRKWTLQQYNEHPGTFTNFHYISIWQQVFENFMALTVFAAFFKVIKLLSFNKRMYLLAHTLKHAGKDLVSYWLIFMVVFFAFSQLYFLVLGSEYLSFSTIIRSMEKLLSVLLGKFNFDEFMNPFRTLGALTFILYMITMKFLLLNILTVLIIASFQAVKHSNKTLQNEFEIVDFMVEQFKAFAGIRSLRKNAKLDESDDTFIESLSDQEDILQDNIGSSVSRKFEKLAVLLDQLESYLHEQNYSEKSDELLCKYAMFSKLTQYRARNLEAPKQRTGHIK